MVDGLLWLGIEEEEEEEETVEGVGIIRDSIA